MTIIKHPFDIATSRGYFFVKEQKSSTVLGQVRNEGQIFNTMTSSWYRAKLRIVRSQVQPRGEEIIFNPVWSYLILGRQSFWMLKGTSLGKSIVCCIILVCGAVPNLLFVPAPHLIIIIDHLIISSFKINVLHTIYCVVILLCWVQGSFKAERELNIYLWPQSWF